MNRDFDNFKMDADKTAQDIYRKMDREINAGLNADNKPADFDETQYAKGLYIKWDNEAQAAKKANLLEVLAEREKKARETEKAEQQMPPEDNKAALSRFWDNYMQNYRGYMNGSFIKYCK